MIIDNVNIIPLIKAFKNFEEFRHNLNTEQEQAGAILAFGYCYELTWQIMQSLLFEYGITVYSPREIFRMAALEKLIDDPEIWFDFVKARMATEHAYEQEEANKILNVLPSFAKEIHKLFERIGV